MENEVHDGLVVLESVCRDGRVVWSKRYWKMNHWGNAKSIMYCSE